MGYQRSCSVADRVRGRPRRGRRRRVLRVWMVRMVWVVAVRMVRVVMVRSVRMVMVNDRRVHVEQQLSAPMGTSGGAHLSERWLHLVWQRGRWEQRGVPERRWSDTRRERRQWRRSTGWRRRQGRRRRELRSGVSHCDSD